MRTIQRILTALVIGFMAVQAATCSAQSSCQNCNGRCQYCVDGRCTPNTHTFGHFQTSWRRWPDPPPAVPVRAPKTAPSSMGEVDLPPVEEEGEYDPELRHRRKRATGAPGVQPPEEPSVGPTATNPFLDDDRKPQPADSSTSRNMPRHLPSRRQQASLPSLPGYNPLRRDFYSAPMAARVSYEVDVPKPRRLENPIFDNPLR